MTSWDHTFIQSGAILASACVAGVIIQPEFAGPIILIGTLVILFFWVTAMIMSEFEAIREQLDRVDRRTARMEGQRVGNDVSGASVDGQ